VVASLPKLVEPDSVGLSFKRFIKSMENLKGEVIRDSRAEGDAYPSARGSSARCLDEFEVSPMERPMAKKIFSFDGETNGLWGEAFAIGALVYDEQGTEVARFVGRLPDTAVTEKWVQENVLPQLTGVPITHTDYDSLLTDFAKFYLANKEGADIIVHMGYIVEAKVLRDMHDRGHIGDWDGPYPLFDVSGNLQAAGADPTSVDKFATKHGLSVGEFEGGTHNPLYDSAIAAAVYRYLNK